MNIKPPQHCDKNRGAVRRIRTGDRSVNSRVLYQLS